MLGVRLKGSLRVFGGCLAGVWWVLGGCLAGT